MKWKWRSGIKQRDKNSSLKHHFHKHRMQAWPPCLSPLFGNMYNIILYYIHVFSHQILHKNTVRVTFTLSTYLCVLSSVCADGCYCFCWYFNSCSVVHLKICHLRTRPSYTLWCGILWLQTSNLLHPQTLPRQQRVTWYTVGTLAPVYIALPINR